MACHKLSATLQSAISLRQGQKDRGEKKSHFLSTPLSAFYIFSSLSSIIPHKSTILVSWSSEVSRLHFYPSLEKTSVSHVKYLHGHSVLFFPFLSSLCLSSKLNIQMHFISLPSLCSLH